MYRHGLKEHKTFKSETKKTTVIGGEINYCAERFGYDREMNGIKPSLVNKTLSPLVSCMNSIYAEYIPYNGLVSLTTSNKQLYLWDINNKTSMRYAALVYTEYPSAFDCVVDGVNYRTIVSGSFIVKINAEGKVSTINTLIKVIEGKLHCGRIFAIDDADRYMLRWSGYAFNEWKEGVDKAGYVRLDAGLGKMLNLFVFNEKIVIVREFGITVFSTLGDFRHMRFDVCDKYRLPPVYQHSSVIFGGQLWIYTQNGMYKFDGSTISKAPFEEIMLDYVLQKPKIVDDRYFYYSATKGDGKCLFVYDTVTGAGSPFAKNCHNFFTTPDGLYAFSGNYIAGLLPDQNDANRFWISKPFTFGAGKRAALRSLTIDGSGSFTVETDCDARKLYANGAGVYNYAECGHCFTFKVTGVGSITEMTAEWEVLK